jgi:uncharacterized protein (TIGR03435 family)
MSNLTSAFVSALVDFVWQGTAVGLVAAAALLAMRRASPHARYVLCCAALIVMVALPIVTTTQGSSSTMVPESTESFISHLVVAGSDDGVEFVDARAPVAPVMTMIAPWILPVWSLGVFALSLRLLLGGIEVRTLRRSGQPADDGLCALAARLMPRMGVNRHVRLLTSPRAAGPSTIGWLHPVILLPPAAAMGLTVQQLEAVLAHELAHIRRHDYLVNIVQMTVETLLFYHPAVWWVSHRTRVERELCCDDEAVKLCGNATTYARALVTMARQQVPLFAMGSSGGSLTARVGRLLGMRGAERRPVGAGFAAVAIALAFAAVAINRVQGQSERLRFEVASIKPADPAGPRGFSGLGFLPGGVVNGTQVPILAIVAAAYDLPWRQIEGPDDLMKERFAIDAKAPASALPPERATFDQTIRAMAPVLQEMLKTLLAERFKLAGHIEKREVPLYALVVGSKGPKLKPAERDCAPKTPTDDPCGGQGGGPAGGLRLRGAEVAMLAEMLNSLLDRSVVDRTGVKGRYDIDLPPWNPGLPLRDQSADPDPEPQPDPGAPSISTVLQPLGLRLEPIRGPLEIYVVDHVERPTPN